MTKVLLFLTVLSCGLQAQPTPPPTIYNAVGGDGGLVLEEAQGVDMSQDIEVGTKRSPTPAMNAFRKQTGYAKGRPGWVIDHVVPYCAGGPVVDVVANLQWQEAAASYRKDVFERQLCAAMKRQGLVIIKEQ